MTEQELQIATGIRKINTKYFDYLYSIKHLFDSNDVPTVSLFVTEVTERGNVTVIFINQKGMSLPIEIKREIIELYTTVYETLE